MVKKIFLNSQVVIFLKNILYTLSSNLTIAIVSTAMALIIPRIIEVEDYGYWQLFVFYGSYVPFLQFGLSDGFYLRYGGKKIENLDKGLISGQFLILVISQIFIAFIIIIIQQMSQQSSNIKFIWQAVAFFLIIVNIRYLFIYILQALNQFKKYSKIVFIDRCLFILFIIALVISENVEYKNIIIVELISISISLIYAIYLCRYFLILKLSDLQDVLLEIAENITAGISIVFANIASMLMIGIFRFGISNTWNIETFGKVSLTLYASNCLMIFVRSISLVLFPILKNINQDKLQIFYVCLRNLLSVVLLGMLIFYYPIKVMLVLWLPKYADSLIYMALLFPICLFESKVSLLINTYLKSMRQELLLVKINWFAVIMSFLLTIITVLYLHNLDLAILSIVVVFASRCILAEYFMGKLLALNLYRDICLEIVMVILFIVSSWFIDSWWCTVLYVLGYMGYLWLKKDDVKASLQMMKSMV